MVTGFASSVSRNFCEGILRLPSCTASWKLRIHSFVCVFCSYQMCILYMLEYSNIISTGQEIMISWYCVVQVGYIALGKTCWLIVIGAPNDEFLPNTLKTLFTAIQSIFRSLEMHSKWHYRICTRSVILGEVESFRNYKDFSIICPILDAIQRVMKVRIFLIPLSIIFLNPEILGFLFHER